MFRPPPPAYQTPVRGGVGGAATPPEPPPLTGEVVPDEEAAYPEVQRQAPPSSYAVVDFLDCTDGSAMRLGGLTLIRSVFIAPGLWIASKISNVPLTFGQVCGFSLASSATITGGMVGWYAIKRRRSAARARA